MNAQERASPPQVRAHLRDHQRCQSSRRQIQMQQLLIALYHGAQQLHDLHLMFLCITYLAKIIPAQVNVLQFPVFSNNFKQTVHLLRQQFIPTYI